MREAGAGGPLFYSADLTTKGTKVHEGKLNKSADRVAKILEGLVGGLQADETETRVLEIEHGVDGKGDDGGIKQHVQPTAGAAFGHGEAGQQAAKQGDADQQGKDQGGQVGVQGDGAGGGDVDHLVERG